MIDSLERSIDPSMQSPIFLIGTGRSGSTIVFEALAHHPALAWFSNYDDTFPTLSIASAAPRIFASIPVLRELPQGEKPQHRQGQHWLNRVLPKPSEAYNKWRHLCGEDFLFTYCLHVRPTDWEAAQTRRAVRTTIKMQRKTRFLAKITGPSRIGYLKSIFPGAFFVNVIREPKATIHSMLGVEYWKRLNGHTHPIWSHGLPEDWQVEWAEHGSTPLALAAIQYKNLISVARREATQYASSDYIELRYSDYVKNAQNVVQTIYEHCGLVESDAVARHLSTSDLRDMNLKYRSGMSIEDQATIDQIVGDVDNIGSEAHGFSAN